MTTRDTDGREFIWNGVLDPAQYNADALAARHRLADAAKAGDWPVVLRLLDERGSPLTANDWRPGGTAWFTPLHQAAWHGAPSSVATEIMARGALRTVTDGEGRFTLQPAPAGTFFVHIDGRTAVGSDWPDGSYYPTVGKSWTAVAGRDDNLAGETGEVFLPLIVQGTLQPVSTVEETPVGFPPAVVAENPELEGVEILIPPNSLFSDNGSRGGRVGIAPVAPDRIPSPLPPGLAFPLVITIQTDGAQNFDRPVPVRFPNLPDPETGEVLLPGAKSALWSFNHDTGEWDVVGPMTVSADGRFVETDPGFGVRQPGWHGARPGTRPDGPPPRNPCNKSGCFSSLFLGAADCAISFIPIAGTAACIGFNVGYGGVRSAYDCATGDGIDCGVSVAANAAAAASCAVRSVPGLGSLFACAGAAFSIGKNCGGCLFGGRSAQWGPPPGMLAEGPWAEAGAQPFRGIAGTHAAGDAFTDLEAHVEFMQALAHLMTVSLGSDIWTRAVDFAEGNPGPLVDQVNTLLNAAFAAAGAGSVGGTGVTDAEIDTLLTLPRPSTIAEADIRALAAYFNQTAIQYAAGLRTHVAAGRTDFMDAGHLTAALDAFFAAMDRLQLLGFTRFDPAAAIRAFYEQAVATYTDPTPGTVDYTQVRFLLVDEENNLEARGTLRADGRLPLAALRPETLYRLRLYDPSTGFYGRVTFRSARTGVITELPLPMLAPLDPAETDTDGEGLADLAEEVLGTDPTLADTDDDGINDLAEV